MSDTAAVADAAKEDIEKRMEKSLKELERAINEQKTFIASMPAVRCNEDVLEKAKFQKILGQMEEDRDWMSEDRRRTSVVRAQDEMHPPKVEECPICLEMIKIASPKLFVNYPCCGGQICRECTIKLAKKSHDPDSCPLCRGIMNKWDTKERLEENAKRGQSWAQHKMGLCLMSGKKGFPVDMKEAMRLWQLAADQGNPESLFCIAGVYLGEIGAEGTVAKDESKGWSLTKQAADGGDMKAQINLAGWYSKQENWSPCVHYATLRYSHGPVPILDRKDYGYAAYLLGWASMRGRGGLKKSLYVARHYLEEAVENEFGLEAYTELAQLVLGICKCTYDGIVTIPGHSAIPRTFYWYRRAAAAGVPGTTEHVRKLEGCFSKKCCRCGTPLEKAKKNCARCKSAWYCGRECQVRHWRDGHKVDCVEQENV